MDPNAQSNAAVPPPRHSRIPYGPGPPAAAYPSSSSCGPPPLLELAAANPMYTDLRGAINVFAPDAQMLFHVLGICDKLMNSSYCFIHSSPAWLPIVSQLYISVLWNVMIIQCSGNSSISMYAHHLYEIVHHIGIKECMIPGPLVPFFQSLASFKGHFHSICVALPDFHMLWDSQKFRPSPDYARQIPIPAIMLDQLHYFSQWPIPADQTSSYTSFEWYRNIFSQGVGTYDPHNRIGPQLCGSLFTSQSRFDIARNFWNSVLDSGITRANAATNPGFKNLAQLLGFQSQTGTVQHNWFVQIILIMHDYARYFKGSVPLKSILPVGIGAVAVSGVPAANAKIRDWFYPPLSAIEPFMSNRIQARREIPFEMEIVFQHAEYNGLGEEAEKYAILAHTNIQWSATMIAQNDWTGVAGDRLHQGHYWRRKPHRRTGRVRVKNGFSLRISRLHLEPDYSDDDY